MADSHTRVDITPSSDTPNCLRIHVGGDQWCKVYGWDPEQARQRAEIIAAALTLSEPVVCGWCGETVAGPCNHPDDPCGLYREAK